MKILVSGASSQIGYYLLPKLTAAGHQCYGLSRIERQHTDSMHWLQGDLQSETNLFADIQPLDVWIHLGPLSLVDNKLEQSASAGVKRFIGFSTTSIFTKKHTSNTKESDFIQAICQSEQNIQEFCSHAGINWTILRPTLIYGCGRDKNIAFIHKMISKFGFFLIVGSGSGLRQPVHADDLAMACCNALATPKAFNKAYNLSGGETLTYRAMVEKVFHFQNRATRIFIVPTSFLKAIVLLLAYLPKYKHLTPAMVDRINQDMVFDHSEALEDLDFRPRWFLQKKPIRE